MITTVSFRRGLIFACATGVLAVAGLPAVAQDKAASPVAAPVAPKKVPPPTGPLEGRPEKPGAQALAPVAAPPLPTPATKLPLAKIKVPDGFKVEVYASGINNARSVQQGDKGTVFVGNWRGNKVWAITDKNGKREAKVIYEKLDWPNGIAFQHGDLYIAEHGKIS